MEINPSVLIKIHIKMTIVLRMLQRESLRKYVFVVIWIGVVVTE